MRKSLLLVSASLIVLGMSASGRAKPPPVLVGTIDPTKEVIYGRRDGMALTILVYRPKVGQNGIGLLWIGSGGYNSGYEFTRRTQSWGILDIFLKRAFTVFAVLHCSQSRYTVPEMLVDVHRSVRYVRTYAREWMSRHDSTDLRAIIPAEKIHPDSDLNSKLPKNFTRGRVF